MKTIDIGAATPSLPELLELASNGNVILRSPDGKEFLLAEVDDLAREVAMVRQQPELMDFLTQRCAAGPRSTSAKSRNAWTGGTIGGGVNYPGNSYGGNWPRGRKTKVPFSLNGIVEGLARWPSPYRYSRSRVARSAFAIGRRKSQEATRDEARQRRRKDRPASLRRRPGAFRRKADRHVRLQGTTGRGEAQAVQFVLDAAEGRESLRIRPDRHHGPEVRGSARMRRNRDSARNASSTGSPSVSETGMTNPCFSTG